MNTFYFGDSFEFIEAEYAKSNRSSCKACKVKIDKDELRLGLINDDDHMSTKYYYHVDCFKLFPRHKELTEDKIDEKIYGIENLDEKDLVKIKETIKKCIINLREGKKATKKQTKKETKVEPAKEKKKASKGRKSKKDDSESDESFEESESEESPPSESDSEESEKKKKKSKPAKGKGKVKVKISPFTPAQNEQYEKYCEEFQSFTAEELKQLLGKNKQTKNGSKDDLISKCADGKLLGQIPTCSSCGGGRLRFDRESGIYTCPGYMEDTDFIHCNKKYEFNEVKRAEWIP